MTARLLIATTNAGKQREFRRLLAHLTARLVTPDEIGLELEVEEPYRTYAENAVAKADAYCRASMIPTVADDSGIEVAALGWGPGVRSARWGSGPRSQAEQLLDRLQGVDDRRARMVCALAVAVPGDSDPTIRTFQGVLDGSIAAERRGSGGFGYDPIFLVDSGMTTAQLSEIQKDRISHRGRAVAAATPWLLEVVQPE